MLRLGILLSLIYIKGKHPARAQTARAALRLRVPVIQRASLPIAV